MSAERRLSAQYGADLRAHPLRQGAPGSAVRGAKVAVPSTVGYCSRLLLWLVIIAVVPSAVGWRSPHTRRL